MIDRNNIYYENEEEEDESESNGQGTDMIEDYIRNHLLNK